MKQKKVFISRQIPPEGVELLKSSGLTVDIWEDELPPSDVQLVQRVKDCDGLISMITDRIDSAFLQHNSQLTVISNFGVGYDNIDLQCAHKLGIAVGNTPGVLADATADLAFGLMLAAARHIVAGYQNVTQGEWRSWSPCGFRGSSLKGKVLGIFGMGEIGLQVAKRAAKGFSMPVYYTSPRHNEKADNQLAAKKVELSKLLAISDFLSVHAKLTPETETIFNKEVFAQMKPSAIFINTARGKLVQQNDLYHALKSGAIAAAGLDVTDPEPLPVDSPLLTLPNCVVTPHIGSATYFARGEMSKLAAQNILAGLANSTLPHKIPEE